MSRLMFPLVVLLWVAASSAAGAVPEDTVLVPGDTVAVRAVASEGDSLERLTEQLGAAEESPLLELIEDVFPRTSIETRSRVVQRLQPARGFAEGKYLGSAVKSYQRLKARYEGSVEGGILLEKDAGERRFDDFVAGYVRINEVGPLRSIIVGDYLVEAGQGVALWRAYDFQKGADVMTPAIRAGRGVLPYVSSDENGFLSGIAGRAEIGDVNLIAFYSRRRMTGTVDSTGSVTSVYTSGYFRTATEEEKRNSFSETLLGFHGEVPIAERIVGGVTGYTATYDRSLGLAGGYSGNRATVLSADGQAMVGSAQIFGEWGMSNEKFGGISGIHLSPGAGVEIVGAYRSYAREFSGLHGNGFGERQGNSGERGWYMGVAVRPARGVHLSSYFDTFSFPEGTATSLFPARGHEILVEAEVSLASRLLVTPRYRRKLTVEKGTVLDGSGWPISFDDQKTDEDFRLTLDYSLSSKTKLRSRIEYTNLRFLYVGRQEHGFLVYQDVQLQASERVRLNARTIFFRTDSFDSGIAEYERDLDGILTVPILYGRGVRWYLLAHYALSDVLRCSFKYSELIRDDVKTLGSGLEELPGNRDNRISVQLDCSL